ncbi:MarR family winged helix-turn-helix transcriptional regulator [Acetobacterium wieringae]|uniref:MarR family winged helix-turn-helix transcriptional regulator n=1 Tax=Acetobacterium wieringae TaxID=52694 RepID=A0ABY6HDH9_9FIRM|nr:MarR family winged helix-turn-helix transcriptional regulator [Acetobacterium wieringae]UYO62549.1 MarR family winged helix-turn-helix transcriptional regulator [Acetobacterium wieringae]
MMDKQQINAALFAFLQAIYKFEQMELTKFSISWQEMLLLKQLLNNNDFSMGYVTELLGIKPFQATRLVDGLVRKELLLRFEKESDRRIKSLQITAKGKAVLAEIDDFHYQIIEKASKNLGSERTHSILSMMFQLEELLSLEEPSQKGNDN